MPYSNNPALRAHLESQVNLVTEMARTSYESVRKLSELNLQLAQHLIEDSVNASRQFLSCSDVMQLGALAISQLEPVAQHLRSYQQQVMSVLSGMQVELTHQAETLIPDVSRSASAAAEEITRRGAEATAALARQYRGNGATAPNQGANGAHRA